MRAETGREVCSKAMQRVFYYNYGNKMARIGVLYVTYISAKVSHSRCHCAASSIYKRVHIRYICAL